MRPGFAQIRGVSACPSLNEAFVLDAGCGVITDRNEGPREAEQRQRTVWHPQQCGPKLLRRVVGLRSQEQRLAVELVRGFDWIRGTTW